MKKLILGLMLLFLAIGLSAELVVINPAETRAVTFNIIECNDDYTTIEFLLNFYRKEIVEIAGDHYHGLNIPSGVPRLEKGNPELPIVAYRRINK